MKFKLEIDSNNDALTDNPYGATAALLRMAADALDEGTKGASLKDPNGNAVGSFELDTVYDEDGWEMRDDDEESE